MTTSPNDKIKSNERFTRWQGVLREHVTFVNNLILTISIAVVGFCVTLLNDTGFMPTGYKKILLTLGLTLTLLSIPLGICTTMSRLFDFKTTLKKIKTELQKSDFSELDFLKTWMEFYGKTTWILLRWQIGTFFIGTLLLIIAFCFIYSNKLF